MSRNGFSYSTLIYKEKDISCSLKNEDINKFTLSYIIVYSYNIENIIYYLIKMHTIYLTYSNNNCYFFFFINANNMLIILKCIVTMSFLYLLIIN